MNRMQLFMTDEWFCTFHDRREDLIKRDICASCFIYQTIEAMKLKELKFPQECHPRETATAVILARVGTCLLEKISYNTNKPIKICIFPGFISSSFLYNYNTTKGRKGSFRL